MRDPGSGHRPVCRYRALVLTVTSVNVNGLRAAAKKGFVEWLAATSADVLCLQEVRAEPQQLPEHVRTPDGWHVTHAPAAAKGRAGVSSTPAASPTASGWASARRSSTPAAATSRPTCPV